MAYIFPPAPTYIKFLKRHAPSFMLLIQSYYYSIKMDLRSNDTCCLVASLKKGKKEVFLKETILLAFRSVVSVFSRTGGS